MKFFYYLFTIALIGWVSKPSFSQCPIPNACTPGNATNAQAALFGGGIFQVKIGPTFINNSSGATEGYQDFCSLGATTVSLGSPIQIVVRTGNTFSENLRIFVDINNDQSFTASTELLFSSNNAKVHTANITIPSGVTGQQIKLRISSDLITAANLPGPCTTPEYSQVEDYAIILQENVTPPIAAFTVSDTLTCSGNVTFTDQSINNPTSWTWEFGDGQSSNLQNPVHQYALPGLFSVKLKVSSPNGVDSLIKLNLVRYNDSVPVAAVCQPITINHCCGYGISRVKIHTLDNTSGLGSYENYSCTKRVSLLQGRAYPVLVGTNPNQNQDTRIWIDYNSNGIYESNEVVFEALNARNPEGSVLISNDTSVKLNRPLRMRVISEFAGGPFGPCTSLDKGQCEDYTVYINANTQAPIASFQISSSDFCQPTFSFSSTSTNVISLYHWFFGDGTDSITLIPNITHTYSNTGSYDVKLLVAGPYGVDSITTPKAVNYFGAPAAACTLNTQAGGPQLGTGIKEVRFGSILKQSGNSSEGYQNYSCSDQTSVLKGQSVTLTIKNSGEQPEKVRVWIDWNANGTFATDEQVMFSQADTVHSIVLTIPSTATENTTLRMRVASNFQNAGGINSCGNIQLGQAEDYGVVVLTNTSKPKALFSTSNPISCSGIVQFTDSSLNLPDSYLWDFGDGTTSSEPSPLHNYAAAGTYTIKLIATNAFGSDTLIRPNYIQVTQVTGMVPSSCAPVILGFCCQYGISQVNFAGINQSSGNAAEGNRDFTCGTIGSAIVGTSIPITITNSGTNPENVGVWIDWNNDGSFSDNELAFSSNASTNHGGTIAIPGNAAAGLGLRVRVVSDFANGNLSGACSPLQFGQAEDYQIILQGNSQPPIALFAANEVLTCSGTISFSDTSFNAPTAWKWYFGDGDSSSLRNPTHTYSNPGQYTVTLRVSNANGGDTLSKINYVQVVDNLNLKPAPCQPSTVNTVNNQGVGIRSVTLNTISRISPTAPTENYVDASCSDRTELIVGQSYTITVLTNTNFPESCRAWIDWNNNGNFEDPSERILNTTNSTSHTGLVSIPANARLDTALRFRVISDFGGGGPGGGNIQPCNNPNFGQVEDYAVVVKQNSSAPISQISSVSQQSCNGYIQFRDSSSFVPTSWFWDFGDGMTDTVQNPTHQYLNTGFYTVKLKVANNFGVDSVTIEDYVFIAALYGPKPASCINSVVSPGVASGITRVRFGSIDRTSGLSAADGGYQDYTCSDTTSILVLTSNQTNPIIVNSSAGNNRENCRAFIDFNNNGIFENTEAILNSSNNNVHSANPVFTALQCAGVPVRMRIITDSRFNQITNACYNPASGQVEDYSVRLIWAVGNQEILGNSGILIYPNPGTGKFHVSSSFSTLNSWKLLDMNGREVAKGDWADYAQNESINLENSQNGIYQLRIETGRGPQVHRLVIQK